ncbi:MAG TPA: hypothetical protein PKG52_05175 [bacterium]|nr:hypothetical protein [bacterium]HPS30156.1 hypothetical protein [bacterium]
MKKVVFTVLAFAVVIVMSSCSATMSTSSASTMGSLKAESHSIWTRPLEMGFTVIGMAEGTAQDEKMGDSLSSKKVVDNTPSFFLSGSIPDKSLSPMMKLAAFNAIQKANADGMYVTMAKEEDTDSGKKAWVKGVLLKLEMYGPVTIERADAVRSGHHKDCKKDEKKGASSFLAPAEPKTEEVKTAE